jgi:hypothetical protein
MGLVFSARDTKGQPIGKSTVLLSHLGPARQQWVASAVLSTKADTTTCVVEYFIGPPPYRK